MSSAHFLQALFVCLCLVAATSSSIIRSSAQYVKTDAAQIYSGSQTAQAILSEVEDMAQVGAEPDKVITIKKLAGELESVLHETKWAAEQQVDKNLYRIKRCNQDQFAAYRRISESTKVTVGNRRTAHATCRDSEKQKHLDAVKKCNYLKEYLEDVVADSPVAPTDNDDEMVEYVSHMDSHWCPQGGVAKEKSKTCKRAVAVHKEEKTKCDRFQAQFELAFCSWRIQLTDMCQAYKTCYDDALKIYNDHKAVTQKLVLEWKAEYVALRKITCYINIWLNEDKLNHAKTLSDCKALKPDDSVMDVNFRSPYPRNTCSLEDIRDYPGSPGFKPVEYSKWDFVAEVTKCEHFDLAPVVKNPEAETCDTHNSFGMDMPDPETPPYTCPLPEAQIPNTRPEKCPCETSCDCSNTQKCIDNHVKAATPEAQQACGAVLARNATNDEKRCCKDLLRHCYMYQEDCFQKLARDMLVYDEQSGAQDEKEGDGRVDRTTFQVGALASVRTATKHDMANEHHGAASNKSDLTSLQKRARMEVDASGKVALIEQRKWYQSLDSAGVDKCD